VRFAKTSRRTFLALFCVELCTLAQSCPNRWDPLPTFNRQRSGTKTKLRNVYPSKPVFPDFINVVASQFLVYFFWNFLFTAASSNLFMVVIFELGYGVGFRFLGCRVHIFWMLYQFLLGGFATGFGF